MWKQNNDKERAESWTFQLKIKIRPTSTRFLALKKQANFSFKTQILVNLNCTYMYNNMYPLHGIFIFMFLQIRCFKLSFMVKSKQSWGETGGNRDISDCIKKQIRTMKCIVHMVCDDPSLPATGQTNVSYLSVLLANSHFWDMKIEMKIPQFVLTFIVYDFISV